MYQSLLNRLTSPHTSLFMIGGMFCLPFIIPYHYSPIPSFYNEWTAAICGLLGLLALFKPSFWHTLQLPRSSLIFFGLLLITNLQSLIHPQDTVSNLPLIQSYLIWAFLLSILGHYLRSSLGWEKLVPTLAWSLVIAGALNVIFVVLQVLQKIGIYNAIPTLQSYGMLAQNNNFADLIALAMISLLFLGEKKHFRPHLSVIGLFLGLLLLSLSGSRSSALYLMSIPLLSWLLHKRQQETSTHSGRLLKLSLMLLPTFVVIQLLLAKYLPQALVHTPMMRAIEIMNEHPHSLRWQFWQTSLYLFQQAPFLGTGVGHMRWESYLLVTNSTANPAHIFFEHAHNLFFNLLAEMGIFAFIIALGGLLLWTRNLFREHAFQLEQWWMIAILSILGIHSMLEYPLWYSFFLGIFAFLMGAGDAKTIELKALAQPVKKWLSWILFLVVAYGLQQLIFMQVGYSKLENQITIASQKTITDIQKQRLVDDMLWVNQHTLLAPTAELVIATLLLPNINQAADQLKLVESAVKFMPLRRACLNFIILLELNQQHAEALQHLRRMQQISGTKLQYYIQQLPLKHAQLLNALLAEIEQGHPTS